LEESTIYKVDITPEAETYFNEILHYLYKYHSIQSADRKSAELLDLAISLEKNPQRGSREEKLKVLGKKITNSYYTSTLHEKPLKSFISLAKQRKQSL
jgi:hypothetical protein